MNQNSQSRLQTWAQLRFSIIGALLASPPEPGELVNSASKCTTSY